MVKIIGITLGVYAAAFYLLKPPEYQKTLHWRTDIGIKECQTAGGKVAYNGEVWQGYAGCWVPKEE
jgi:hypothetical protein